MAKQFSKFLYDGILQEQAFQVLFNELLISYAAILIDKPLTKYDEKFSKLLRYADILSLSDVEEYQNIAQQIVIILSQVFPNDEKN